MNSNIIFWLQGLVIMLTQIIFFNGLQIGVIPSPNAFVLLLLLLPVQMDRSITLLISFGLGLVEDIFTQSLGYHAFASCTFVYIRHFWLTFLVGQSTLLDKDFSIQTQTPGWIITYFAPMILLYQLCWYVMNHGINTQNLLFSILNNGIVVLETFFICFSAFVLFFMQRKNRV